RGAQAQDVEQTGVFVAGLGKQERILNALPDDINVISLRPTGFMENLFFQIDMIKNMNIMGSPVKADVKMGMVATEDVATVAAEKLTKLDFKGKTHLDLLGNKDYSQKEVASIIGKAIGKPELPYVEFSYEDTKKAMIQNGISGSVADAFNGIYKGMNAGYYTGIKQTPETTPTTLEDFAKNVFKYAIQ
ncbi:MAG: hypothetical protein ACRDEB_05565, partial [Chitinophagaceae bacterium]